PDLLPQRGLGGQHLGRAAGIAIMTRRGTRHAPILPQPRPASGAPYAVSSDVRLIKPEPDLQGDLEVAEPVVLDMAAHAGDLEPVEVVQGLGGARDGSLDGIVDAHGG